MSTEDHAPASVATAPPASVQRKEPPETNHTIINHTADVAASLNGTTTMASPLSSASAMKNNHFQQQQDKKDEKDNNVKAPSSPSSPPLPPPVSSPRKRNASSSFASSSSSSAASPVMATTTSPNKSFSKVSPVAHLTGRPPFPANKALPQPQLPSLNHDIHNEDDDDEDDFQDDDEHDPRSNYSKNQSPRQQQQQQHNMMQPSSLDAVNNTNNTNINNHNTNNSNINNNTIPTLQSSSSSSTALAAATASSSSFMSVEDLEICQRLDLEYERALEEREIAYNARFHSVRQSAVGSVAFMLFFLFLATLFYMHHTHWTMSECLLFSVYTITTVGYGNPSIPKTAAFQLYTIWFIFIGVATLTIMVAQIYQCIALEASRAQHSRDQSELARRGLDMILTHPNHILLQQQQRQQQQRQQQQQRRRQRQQRRQSGRRQPLPHNDNASPDGQTAVNTSSIPSSNDDDAEAATAAAAADDDDDMMEIPSTAWDRWNQYYQCLKLYFQTSEWGRGISVLFPFAGLILIGAIIVGPIEGWTPLQALYFAVVSLTTVGFGDYYPTKAASIWFCIIWLPFSVGFMSLFLGNIANFYLRLSDQNIQRIERQLRRRLRLAKERAEQERLQALRRAHRGQDGNGGGGGSGGAGGASGLELTTMTTTEEDENDYGKGGSVAVVAAAARRNGVAPAGFDVLPMQDGEDELTETEQAARRHQAALFGSPNSDSGGGLRRRERILYNSIYAPVSTTKQQQQEQEQQQQQQQLEHRNIQQLQQPNGNGNDDARPRGQTMATMRDVLRRVRINLARHDGSPSSPVPPGISADPESAFMSRRSTTLMTTASFSSSTATSLSQPNGSFSLKPSFALRVLVQERMAEIIAIDIAGFQSSIEIKDNTLSVTIETLKQTADKWLIPRRARKAFRAVAFEALYFVGEHGLITRGADALYDLTPFEFHGLFNPLLAAMGDAEMMEAWLATTEVLAEVDLKRDLSSSSSSASSTRYTFHVPSRNVESMMMVQGRTRKGTLASPLPQVT